MASKEVILFVIDVGKSTGETHKRRDESDLSWCMRFVWDKITSIVLTGRRTIFVGVVGFRTDETDNQLAGNDDNYNNISVFQPFKQTLMPDLRKLKDRIRPSNTNYGDALSALVLAIDMICQHTTGRSGTKLKFDKKIYLVTNGKGISINSDDIEEIANKIKAENIQLTVLGADFDDSDYGFKEENKDIVKAENERILQVLTDLCEGNFGTMEDALQRLGVPEKVSKKPIASFKGILTLGDPEEYDSAMSIDIERYPRIMVARPPSASNFVYKSDMAAGESSMKSSQTLQNEEENGVRNDLAAVKNARTYQVIDEDAPGGKRDIEMEELAKGYEYGRTAVHIAESDYSITKLETHPGLEIMGFVPQEFFDRCYTMSKTNIIVGQQTNDKAILALSSLIHALEEMESYAIARLVPKEGKDPRIVVLSPSFLDPDGGKFECLVEAELPFAEDIRQYQFPPLDKVITVSGKRLLHHRNLPSEGLMKAMSEYVDSMDLSNFGKDEEGNSMEYLAMTNTFSPVLHRVNQAIQWRAVHPTEDIPPPYEALTQYSKPPIELMEKTQPYLDTLIKAANVQKVPPKQLGHKRTRQTEKPLSGLNIDELLGRSKRTRITPENAIPEFKQMLTTTEDISTMKDAANQLSTVIQSYIQYSVGDSGYGRAVEAIRVMREEMTELEEPGVFNAFMRELKKRMLAGKLGGDRREMWWRIRVHKLGLIDKKESNFSEVTEVEAKEFLST